MKKFQKEVFEFIRKTAKNRDLNNEGGFLLFCPELLIEAIEHFHKAMGHICLYYAVKCNPSPYLIKTLLDKHDKEKDGFDCASINEIKEILKLGGDPLKISFSQVAKTPSEIIEAYNLGVRLTLVDCIEEVEKIYKLKDKVKDLNLLIRYQSNDPTAEYSLGGRFGADEYEIEDILNLIHKRELNFAGVHFHIGTGAHSPNAFRNGIRIAKETIGKAKKLGYNPHIIDIGGGFSQEVKIENFGEVILSEIKKYNLEDMKIIAEPGRFIATNAFSIVSKVVHKHKKNKENMIYYSLDEGIHGNLAFCTIFQKTIQCFPLNPRNSQKFRSVIGGQTCDSHDIVCDFELEELEIGDWVVFYCLGAYSMSVATNFNGYEFRTRPIIQMPMKNNEVVNIPEEIEKKGIPALWGIPNTWKL